MNRIIILATFLLSAMMAFAQKLSVESFEYLPKDLTARTSPRNDRNGIPCAVIRVGIALQGVVFDGNTIGLPVYNTGEYLVYMPEGSRQITIRHDNYVPLTVVFADYGIDKVASSNTYRLTVLTGGLNADQQAQGNFLVMSVTPPTSRVIIDEGEPTAVKADGTLKTYLNNGHHRYRVEAEGYLSQSGTLSMSGARQQITIALQSSKAALTVKTTTSGSKIYINEDYKGTDSWQGELTPGTYLVEARKDGFRSSTKTVTLAKQQTESITFPSLQQIFGSMMVDYEPVDADVYLDNNLIGKSPNVFTNIAAGKHTIKISKAGYADYTGSVTIQENQQFSLSGCLSKNSSISSSVQMANGHEFVDLGLSVKWATCNIGANKPEEYGNYYAWGETETKREYTSSNSLFYNKSNEWLLEHNVIDNEGNLNSAYDPAIQYWSSPWRMPTLIEMGELVKWCEWKWVEINGVGGFKVTGPNGNTIFLPASGWYHSSGEPECVNERSEYWTSTVVKDNSSARPLFFMKPDTFWASGGHSVQRFRGLCVRPVL